MTVARLKALCWYGAWGRRDRLWMAVGMGICWGLCSTGAEKRFHNATGAFA
jgi:hypothetical protein